MKKIGLACLVVLIARGALFAQGNITGIVSDDANNPVASAQISIMTHGNSGLHGHHLGTNYFTTSNADGSFALYGVDAGSYTAIASKMGLGHDADSITVRNGNNTQINFGLLMGRHGDGGMHDNILQQVHITGLVVTAAESGRTTYSLDNNGDLQADYRLLLGPDWYAPGGGAERPDNGDSIWVACGLLGYSRTQPVVVYTLNDQPWRQSGSGHGGFIGYGGGCPAAEPSVLVEVIGTVLAEQPGGGDVFFLDENGDQTADYCLNFGAPSFNPGIARPSAGQTIDVIGGLVEDCALGDVIVVYEAGGLFWREPGDTTALWYQTTASDDDRGQPLPIKPLVATSYPNPFNANANIAFDMPQAGMAKITVYDVLGRNVAELGHRFFPAGPNRVVFDTDLPEARGSAVYFYRIETVSGRAAGKMILLK